MRIDKKEVTNLASIEGTQTVDFTVEPLRSAGLFAITGNTGAGKSTLLDAVCLALYNHAPRFETTEKQPRKLGLEPEDDKHALSATDVRNILRRGCSEGGCKVTFSLVDGTVCMEPFVRMGGTVGSDIKVWRDVSRGASLEQLDKDAADSVAFERYTFEN